jgi:hypothetical protein
MEGSELGALGRVDHLVVEFPRRRDDRGPGLVRSPVATDRG